MARQARAFLGNRAVNHVFAFNPQAIEWGIRENTQSYDTLGGRVVQLLSVAVEDMTINGQAGSRQELRRLASDCKAIAIWQARTQQPVSFRVPSRGWHFQVYVRNMPRVGYEVTTVDYAYQIGLAIEESEGLQEPDLIAGSLKRIAKGIGFNTDWHGGDIDLIRRLYAGIQQSGSAAPDQGITNTGNNAPVTPGTKPDVPLQGTLTDVQLAQLSYWALSSWAPSAVVLEDTKTAVAIALCESSGQACPQDNHGGTLYGLWQNDGCSGNPYTGRALCDPYKSAEAMAKIRALHIGTYGWQCWGCGPDHRGGYTKFLDRAQAAIDKAFSGGSKGIIKQRDNATALIWYVQYGTTNPSDPGPNRVGPFTRVDANKKADEFRADPFYTNVKVVHT